MCSPDKLLSQRGGGGGSGPANPPAQRAPAAPLPSPSSSRTEKCNKGGGSKKTVSFSTVEFRRYSLTLGTVNPFSTLSSSTTSRYVGAPLTLSWEYDQVKPQPLSSYEESLGYDSLKSETDRPRKSTRRMRMSADRRRAILELREDVSAEEVERAERAARKCEERRRRYLAWCRGEEDGGAASGGAGGGGVVPRRSAADVEGRRLSVRQRPSYPPLEDPSAISDAPRKANDEYIALLRRRALASVAASSRHMQQQQQQQIPSSNKAAKRRVLSSRAA